MPNRCPTSGDKRSVSSPIAGCPISARIWQMWEGPKARLVSHEPFRRPSPIAHASIFESNALTTSTFDSNT
jgi:hypothetical protein